MKLILTSDVEGLGHKGDVVQVADGYARNYLVPRKLGIEATRGALKQAEALQRAREEAVAKARAVAEFIIVTLAGKLVVVDSLTAEEGNLFGSIGEKDIASAIESFTCIVVDSVEIMLAAPI